MGEMIKFGIKVALTVATAAALCAALLILYNLISSFAVSNSGATWNAIRDISRIISLAFPIHLPTVFLCITSLFAFKIAYWASDKMLWLIDILG